MLLVHDKQTSYLETLQFSQDKNFGQNVNIMKSYLQNSASSEVKSPSQVDVTMWHAESTHKTSDVQNKCISTDPSRERNVDESK